MAVDVQRRPIDQARVVAKDVDPAELVKRRLEGRCLLLVAGAVAVDVEEVGAQFRLQRVAQVVLDVEADDLLAAGDEVPR